MKTNFKFPSGRLVWLAALGLTSSLSAAASEPDEAPAAQLGIRTNAQIMQLAEASKIKYVIDVKVKDETSPSDEPSEERNERPAELSARPRVTTEGDSISLVEWTCTPEAEQHLTAAEVSFNDSDYAAARAGYLKAVASDPECYIAHSHIGDTFMMDRNDTMAIVHYNRAIELNPFDHKTFAYRGRAHLRQGDGEFALEDLRSSLTLRPHYWLTAAILENSPHFPVTFNDLRLFAPIEIQRTNKKTISVTAEYRGQGSWLAYAICKAVWFGEGLASLEDEAELSDKALRRERKQRAKARIGSGTEFDYGEEFECMMLALETYMVAREDAVSDPESTFEPDETLEGFERAVGAGFTTEALLYGIAAQRFGQAMLLFGDSLREQMRDFVSEMVLYPED